MESTKDEVVLVNPFMAFDAVTTRDDGINKKETFTFVSHQHSSGVSCSS